MSLGLQQRQLEQLYNNATIGLVGSIGAALLVALLVLPYVQFTHLLSWLLIIGIVSLTRFILVKSYHRSTRRDDARLWLNRFVFTIAVSGLAWSLGGFLLHEEGRILVATLLGLCIGGLVAGVTAAFSSHYPSIIAFGAPAILPFSYHLLNGQEGEPLLGMAILLYAAVMLTVAFKVNRLSLSNFNREIDNERLIDKLSRQNDEIATFNAQLEERVVERTDKLEQQINVRSQIESALRDSEARFREIFEHTGVSMLVTDLRGRIMDANTQACETFGYTESEFMRQDLLGVTHVDDRHQARHELVVLASGESGHQEFERRYLRRNGEILWGMVNISATVDSRNDAHYLIVAIQDITEPKLLAQQLAHEANHDALTGLANRHYFERELRRLYQQAQDNASKHVFVYFDLDRFKLVNDACGHVAGDELLRQLGHLLRNSCREQDTMGRLGGDEFGLLIAHTDLESGTRIVNDLMQSIENFQFNWLDRRFSLGASAGIVEINQSSGSAIDALRNADSACYTAKESGRNRIQVYDDRNAALQEREGHKRWVHSINLALQTQRFELYAQPISALNNIRNGLHCEILLRMRDQDEKIVLPGDFLPAAERYGLCPRIDAWVLESVYTTLEAYRSNLDDLTLCTINLSGQSLNDDALLDTMRRIAAQHRGLVDKICFEITETTAITNLTRVRELIQELRVLGCRFALDDFGSGFSSYGYLHDLPVDLLKIDGQFVRDMDTNPVHRAMVRSINEIGHLMGKKTVAEFVENSAVMTQVRQVELDYAQGWHIGKPKPLRELLDTLTDYNE